MRSKVSLRHQSKKWKSTKLVDHPCWASTESEP